MKARYYTEFKEYYDKIEDKIQFLNLINHNIKQFDILQKDLKKSVYLFNKKDESLCYDVNGIKYDPFENILSDINQMLSENSKKITALHFFKNIIIGKGKDIVLDMYYDNYIYKKEMNPKYILVKKDKDYKFLPRFCYDIYGNIDIKVLEKYGAKEYHSYKSLYVLYKDLKELMQKKITHKDLKRIQKFEKINND